MYNKNTQFSDYIQRSVPIQELYYYIHMYHTFYVSNDSGIARVASNTVNHPEEYKDIFTDSHD